MIRRPEDLPQVAPVPRGSRRTWEEPGGILDPDGLSSLFPREAGVDRRAALGVWLLCLGWAVVAGALLRWGRGRPWSTVALAACAAALILLEFLAGPSTSGAGGRTFGLREGARLTEIILFRADRVPRDVELAGAALPLPMWAGATIRAGEDYRLGITLAPDEWRLLVRSRLQDRPEPEDHPDLLIGPNGLAEPGREWVPAGEFLRRLAGTDRVRATVIRKLLPAGRLPERVYEVAFLEAGVEVRLSR